MKERVKTHIPEARDLLYGTQIAPVAFAQRENGATGPENSRDYSFGILAPDHPTNWNQLAGQIWEPQS